MTIVANLLLVCLALPAVAACLYLLLLTTLSFGLAVPARPSRRLRFDVIVPAHDEAASIRDVIARLFQIDWPPDRFRVIVVADNCTDSTAAIARATGAVVFERNDPTRLGKGYALSLAFEASEESGWADACVVVDADTDVSPNLLEAFAARIESGAKAIQVRYRVRNPRASWRTGLLSIALACFHDVRSRARERLGLSCGMRGNGWCVTRRLLRLVPYAAFSLAEDIEYGIELGLAGYRVHYADEAFVAAEMVSRAAPARSQRLRWEGGRAQLLRSKFLRLLRAAGGPDGGFCADLALDLLVPPLSHVALNVAVLVLAAAAVVWWLPQVEWSLWVGLACALSIALYVLRGWQLSGVGARGLLDLACAPAFVLWKLWLRLRARVPRQWVRTEREQA
jgi:cellulose synthase/poly-beta-1,6-N-acetylglucosamine synthase-like glycosyltransferase